MPPPADHRIVFGPFQPDLEDSLLAEVETARRGDPLAPLVLLVGSNPLGLYLTRRIARRGGGVAGLRPMTFIDAARAVAAPQLDAQGIRPLGEAGATLLARALVASLPADSYFSRIKGTAGFEESLLTTLRDLRDAGMAPADLRAIGGRWSRKLLDLADLLERYEKRLGDLRLIDRPGLMALALRILQELGARDGAHAGRFPSGIARLLIYGFYDLTWLQEGLLRRILRQVPATVFFPWRETPGFEYARPLRGRLVDLLTGAPPAMRPAPASSSTRRPEPAALDGLRENLFRAPEAPAGGAAQDPRDAADRVAPCIQVVSAPGEPREAVEAVRLVVDQARAGIPLEETAILYRAGAEYPRLLLPLLEEVGIATYCADGPPLRSSRAARALLRLFDIKDTDYERGPVTDFLALADVAAILGRPTAPGPPESLPTPADLELLSRLAGIVSGRDTWKQRLDRLARTLARRARRADRDLEPEAIPPPDPRLLDAALVFPRLFARLARGIDALPETASWSAMATAVRALLDWVPATPERQTLEDVLDGLAALEPIEARATLRDVRRLLEAELERVRFRRGHFERGHLFLGDVQSARGLGFRAVILVGLVEQSFPVLPRQDPILLDAERERLNQAAGDARLPIKGQRALEERLLFALAAESPRDRLILTFPRLDPDTARERVPSSFLLRILEVLLGRSCDYADLERFTRRDRVRISDLVPADPRRAIHEREFDLAAVLEGIRSGAADHLLLPASRPGSGPFFARGIRFEHRRWAEARLTEVDGLLPAQARPWLAERHGLAGVPLSPTRLEQYMTCPYQYFCERVLGLEPLEDPEQVERLSASDRGTLMHEVLHEFFAGLRAEGRLPLRADDSLALRRRLLEIARRRFAAAEEEGLAGLPLFRAIDRESLEEDLGRVLEDEIEAAQTEGSAGFRPAHFELRFGMPARPEDLRTGLPEDPLSTDVPVPLLLGDGPGLAFKGRIDRIDLTGDGAAARVVDYKSGRLSGYEPDTHAAGTALQLPVYLLAADTLLRGPQAREAVYRSISRRGRFRQVPFHRRDWATVLEDLRAIGRIVRDGVASGVFFHHPDEAAQCRICAFKSVCGEARRARFERKAHDPAARPFLDFKEACARRETRRDEEDEA